MAAYDNLAVQYFYLGDLQRSRYYNGRMLRGKSEAKFSVCRKIAAANTVKFMKKTKSDKRRSEHVGASGLMQKTQRTLGKEF